MDQWHGDGQPGTGGGVGPPSDKAIDFTPFFAGPAFFVDGGNALAEITNVGATFSE